MAVLPVRWMAAAGWPASVGGWRVGVTPFLAWLQAAWRPLTVPVDFFYCVRQ
jgi:predicted ferric reductase